MSSRGTFRRARGAGARQHWHWPHWVDLAAACWLSAASVYGQTDKAEAQSEIQQRIEALRTTGGLVIDGQQIRFSALLAGVYERRGFTPVWTQPADARALNALLLSVEVDGLEPEHYHYRAIGHTDSVDGTPARVAELDIMRTDAALRAAYHVRFGKLDATTLTTRTSLDAPFWGADAAAAADTLLQPGELLPRMRTLRSTNFVYTGMVAALARLRALEHQGGWPAIPPGATLETGVTDVRVPLLRQRLVLSGDLAVADSSPVFDAWLDSAVRSFQHRHGLDVDGVVGGATLAALNVPVSRRIQQLRVNLERARWLREAVSERFVVVNVAGALVYYIRAGQVEFEARAIVGTPYTRTPVFSSLMRYIELNPTWTVPPGIVREILANIRRNSSYLAQQQIRVFDRSGHAVNRGSIAFSRYSAATFPYVFRQDPGPLNPLGLIKFVFPNHYNVYLHDTPARELFERGERTFSHGCIRIENPLQLAELLLDQPAVWNPETLRAEIEKGSTQTVMLPQPIPVLISYWTAAADRHGELHFYPDVYSRDAALLRALDAR